jgi:glutathione-independent formaldehyde dehydrogenase
VDEILELLRDSEPNIVVISSESHWKVVPTCFPSSFLGCSNTRTHETPALDRHRRGFGRPGRCPVDKAAEMGFVPVDARQGDPVEQIRELARARRGARSPGEEEMSGVMAGIDAVGFQACDRDHLDREDPRQVISDLARLVNPTGRVGIAGVFTAADAAPAAHGGHTDGSLHVPWATLFNKGVTVGFGRTHDRRYTAHLRDLIISGPARPSQVVTHHASLDQAPDMYEGFDRRVDGIVKVVFNH